MHATNNTEFYEWMGKKHFCFFQTVETGKRTQNSSVKCGGVNHYPRAPDLRVKEHPDIHFGDDLDYYLERTDSHETFTKGPRTNPLHFGVDSNYDPGMRSTKKISS